MTLLQVISMRSCVAWLVCLSLLGVVTVGCSEKASVEKTETIEGPGGTTERTTTTEIEQSGENPPPAGAVTP
jgi:hypothetical protein